MPLEAEVRFFEKHRREWLAEHEGRFALIKGAEFSFFRTDEEAYVAGVDRWGEVPMLIKQVLEQDRVEDSPTLLYDLLHVQA